MQPWTIIRRRESPHFGDCFDHFIAVIHEGVVINGENSSTASPRHIAISKCRDIAMSQYRTIAIKRGRNETLEEIG
jgi:hypothetical protein